MLLQITLPSTRQARAPAEMFCSDTAVQGDPPLAHQWPGHWDQPLSTANNSNNQPVSRARKKGLEFGILGARGGPIFHINLMLMSFYIKGRKRPEMQCVFHIFNPVFHLPLLREDRVAIFK